MNVMTTQAESEHQLDANGLTIPHGSWPADRNAPGSLELVRRFLNTESLETGADLLRTAGQAAGWLRVESVAARVTAADHHRLLELRHTLREAVSDPGALTTLHAHPITLQFSAPWLVAIGPPIDRFIGELLIAAWEARRNDSWSRLRACENEHCQWVVYDHSRSSTLRWCSEAACGTRARAQRYRTRARHARA
jgi:CGNR zinc finger